jgi:3-oxoacyl-[acyl-carrier-protein] synthase-3
LAQSSRITRLVAGLAEEIVDDPTLARRLGMTPEAVQRRSRGLVRTSAPDGTGPSALAAELSRRLLASAKLAASDLDMIVFATTTPDVTFPGSACYLQASLDAPGIACLDVRSQCVGFLSALDVASKFLICGTYKRVLVASADVPTHVVRYDGVSPELTILTGDCAAVALLEGGGGAGEILSCVTYLDGTRIGDFWCEFPASRHLGRSAVARGERMPRSAFLEGRLYPQIDLPRARATAIEKGPGVFDEALARAQIDRVDVVVLAHVDPEVEDDLARLLAPRTGQIVRRRCAYGFGSTLPVTLADAAEDGRVSAGQTVALMTAGAGASWGATVLRW